jgi:hypothetical protein
MGGNMTSTEKHAGKRTSTPATQNETDPRIAFMMRALDLPAMAYKLAGLLAWRYGNRNGAIFPSQETLARDLQVSVKTVRRTLRLLQSIGLEAEIRRGPDGKNNQSKYRFGGIVSDTRDANSPNVWDTHVPNSASFGHSRPEFRTFETKVSDTTDPLTNRITKRVTKRGRDSTTGTPLPLDFSLTEEMIAFGEKRGWARPRCESEFERFTAYHQDKGTLSRNWDARWRTWVLNGLGFDAQDKEKPGGRSAFVKAALKFGTEG